MKPLPQATLKPQGKVIEKEKSHSGIFLGDKCYWNPANLRNGHAVVLGTSGSGKTQTLKSMRKNLLYTRNF
jgi:Cdc6-like AAA superfamily ATPase